MHYEIYTLLFRSFGHEGFSHPAMIGTNILSIVFIVSPILAVYFYLKNNNASYFWLGLFSVPAFTFGLTPIPFATYLYTNDTQLNTVFIAATNIALIVTSWYLYRANKAFKRDAEKASRPLT